MLTDQEIMAQVLAAFQSEQHDHRQTIGDLLLDLERDPAAADRAARLDQIFRAAHSLKGGARAAGLPAVEAIAHRLEDVFSAARSDGLVLTPDVCDPVYAALDAIGVVMDRTAAGLPDDPAVYEPLLALLGAATGAPALPAAPTAASLNGTGNGVALLPAPDSASLAAAPTAGRSAELAAPAAPAASAAADDMQSVRISTAVLDELLNATGELITCNTRHQARGADAQPFAEITARWRRVWRQVQPTSARLSRRAPTIQPAVHYLEDRPAIGSAPIGGLSADALNDHDVEQLLKALATANELLAEADQRWTAHFQSLREDNSRLEAVSDELHVQVRRTRMLPIAAIWSQVRLQTREMARLAGKPLDLQLDEGAAEADRQVLDRLRDVLLHLLRNAVDHGIESAAARAAAGKPALGALRLTATVSGDRMHVTLSDDGAGLDMAAIRQRALEQGLATAVELERMSEAALADLIFLPGFSTRQSVSALSGRGVGLDIVRSHVERMHGRVEVTSVAGQGCRFAVAVPLSLTSTHVLLLRADTMTYALPLDTVQRIVAIRPGDVQVVEDQLVLPLDGRPIVVTRLEELLNPGAASRRSRLEGQALILGSGERQVACVVDQVLGEQELVQHRLPAPLGQVRFIAGATILTTGQVAPILDVVDLLRAAVGRRGSFELAPAITAAAALPTILVADDSITTRTLEKNILEAAGYRVAVAADGAAAWELLTGAGADCRLVLSDVDMPRMNGFELTQQIRGHVALQHLPVVLVTSLDSPADRERGIAVGADAYIVKRGFDQHTLLETIRQLL